MRLLGNIIWLIFGGLATAVEYILASLPFLLSIIGIPFGLQTLKLGMLAL
ncbi:MAG: YccF domain-containing protein, partial [Parabacteroides sp.]|nr:YccF domain-containing protein [Parabacteroides sp.]